MKNILIKWLQSILAGYARRVLAKSNVEIIGITGSVGKSSSKEAIYEVLSKSKEYQGKVKKSEGNLNNEIGLPLAVLGFDRSPKWWEWKIVLWQAFFRSHFSKYNPLKKTSLLVLEYAADKPGDIKYLLEIARPKVAVLTYIGEAHLEFFGSIDKIAIEKATILKGLPDDGIAILNSDNEYTQRIGLITKKEKIYFGLNEKANVRAKNIQITNFGTKFDLEYNHQTKRVNVPAIGVQQVYAALGAVAVGNFYKIDLDSIIASLKDYKSLEGRDIVIEGVNECLIIDSTYNANPTSMKAALDTLKELKTDGNKIAVLGDMKELGGIALRAHAEIGQIAHKIADKVIAVGPLFKAMEADKWFIDSSEAADFMKKNVKKNDIILVKGSHAMEMEKIVQAISNKP